MAGFAPVSPAGLPCSPRPVLSPINTSFPSRTTLSPPRISEKQSLQSLVDTRHRNRDSLIFVNATIPLSPTSSTSSSPSKESPYDGLAPRKRSGIARLLCCFGREERARRRAIREVEYEHVGEDCHWTEY